MTKEEYNLKIDEEFSLEEIALLNTNIYHNPEHLEYFTKYKMGDYDFCHEYLLKNRSKLTLDHTPEQFKQVAIQQLHLAKIMQTFID